MIGFPAALMIAGLTLFASASPNATPVAASQTDAFASWGGKYWRVEATPVRPGTFQIHYVGWSSQWDETVGCDRLSRNSGSANAQAPLWIEWQGAFYEGSIVREEREGTRIHYKGYDASWDEVVAPSRLVRLGAFCK